LKSYGALNKQKKEFDKEKSPRPILKTAMREEQRMKTIQEQPEAEEATNRRSTSKGKKKDARKQLS